MKTYLDCWVKVAESLFPQALTGGPEFVEVLPQPMNGEFFGFTAVVKGDVAGEFSVVLDGSVLDTPLMGDGVEQRRAWSELLREIADAAAGEMLASTGKNCRVETFEPSGESSPVSRVFAIRTADREWMILLRDRVRAQVAAPASARSQVESKPEMKRIDCAAAKAALSPGLELLLDVELEASLRFGSRELPLGDILALGPGDVVQLDRQVSDPVDLIVADKIVARGEVVLVNGNFGLRVTEVAAPTKRLESIRCLF
jgi:flagellar motor switch protein FliN